jgi:hypothetical protein
MTNDEIANLPPNAVIEFPNGLQAIVQYVDTSNQMIRFEYATVSPLTLVRALNVPPEKQKQVAERVVSEEQTPITVICRWIELANATQKV